MPTKDSPYRDWCGPELKERILACLYMNQGIIEDQTGNATRRLYRLMVTGGKSFTTVRTGIRALDKQGVILREIRGGKDNAAISGEKNKAGSRCYAIMMVEQDNRPEEWAITELQEQINHRLLAATVGAKNEAKRQGQRATKAEAQLEAKLLEKLPEAEPEPVDLLADTNGEDPTMDIAVNLLRRVMDVLNAPPVEVVKHVSMPNGEMQALQNQLAQVQTNLNTAVAAVKEQDHEIDLLKRENAELKSQLGKHRGQSNPLMQTLKDNLTTEQWEALMKQKPKNKP